MLVLSRKMGESIRIGHHIEITILEVKGEVVRVGIAAPKEIGVHRREIYDLIEAQNRAAASSEALDLLSVFQKKSDYD